MHVTSKKDELASYSVQMCLCISTKLHVTMAIVCVCSIETCAKTIVCTTTKSP